MNLAHLTALLRLPRVLLLAAAFAGSVHAQAPAPAPAGQVTHVQGMATAQQPDGSFRFLGQGDAVLEGDTLATTERGFAVLTFRDGSKYTLRPSSAFTVERFAHGEGQEAAWLKLLKGGVRVVTGLVGKRNPAGVELRTPTATIGIRGTSFDARLCGDDCRSESAATAGAAPPAPVVPVAARVVQLNGQASAFNRERVSRSLAVGGSVFEGEEVRTGEGSTMVLGFRDQSVVSLNPNTVMRVTSFRFNQPGAQNESTLGLLRGGMRALTGLIGKQSPDAVKIKTVTSVIGIRGTGMDILCEGPCVDPELGLPPPPPSEPGAAPRPEHGLFMVTWEGTPYFALGPLDVPLDRAGHIGADNMPRILLSVPEFMRAFAALRPDTVAVDWPRLFATVDPGGADGLYVYVRDGHVYLRSGDSVIDLGPGEAAWSGKTGEARRIDPVPGALTLDPTPIPDNFSGLSGPLMHLFGVTVGRAGTDICTP
ncbi:FecR family protein [Ramlibacter rhizophilus]|uniref:FecR protein domain-containing protein n=1 Tax=Ramlibacter rhizophilus TaxID=1781167 RepID=A0A4Z0BYG1_9BURK|nr:FecR family protein [Ramlibacter rhizophilus]TFZ03338.1 hypothetical protein EZ242_05495 [Ramlibacter rhizophilus]